MDACTTARRPLPGADLKDTTVRRIDTPAPPVTTAAGPTMASDRAPTPGGFRLTHMPALDGLRGLACLLVISFHLYPQSLSGGYFGVDIFFVLSGFLITTLLLQEWQDTGGIDLKNFFARRVLRLMPAFVAMLAVCWVVAAFRVPGAELLQYTKAAFLNLLAQGSRPDLLGDCLVPPYAHTWSLAIEDQFYVMWPLFLCAILTQSLSRRWVVSLVVVGIVACAGARTWLALNGRGGPEMYIGLQNRADALLLGCLISMLAVWNMLPQGRWFRIGLRVTAVCMWGLLIFTCRNAMPQAPYLFRGVLTLFAIGTAICLLDLVIGRPRILSWVLENRALRAIGKLSYGIYLWHWPTIIVLFSFLPDKTQPKFAKWFLIVRLLAYPCFFLVAFLSYQLIEKPFLRLRPARRTQIDETVDSATDRPEFAPASLSSTGELAGAT